MSSDKRGMEIEKVETLGTGYDDPVFCALKYHKQNMEGIQ